VNVLFLTTAWPTPDLPAAGIFVQEHARAAARHANVAVVHLDRREGARPPYRVERLGGQLPLWRVSYPYGPLPLTVACHYAAAAAGYGAARRSGFRPDVLHASFFLAAGPAAALARATGIPFVATEHWTAFLPEDPTELGPVWRLAARLSLRRARWIMPVSENLAGAMRGAGIRGRFSVVPNAVDVTVFRPGQQRSDRLLTVALLGWQKGVDVLLRALALLEEGPALDVVGDGPGRSDHERLARELGLGERVVFHGLQPKQRVAELMRQASLFVLASRYDNSPCVLVEAQASGLPVVASHVGGVPELVGGDGLLVCPDDPAALASAIHAALGRDWDIEAIAHRARSRFSLEAVGEQLADVYRTAVA
jgi:glycosyltransferase involved in cell wall biosynthesis